MTFFKAGMIARALDILVTAVLIAWLFVGPLAWILRDGLGPDSVPSHGMEAVFRFLTAFYWGPVALGLVALALIFRCRNRRARGQAPAMRTME